MKLITKKIWNRLVALGDQDVPNPVVPLKLFTPDGEWTWFITSVISVNWEDRIDRAPKPGEVPVLGENGVEDITLFGWVCGHENELGYVSMRELIAIRGKLGLPIERDLLFEEQRLDDVKILR